MLIQLAIMSRELRSPAYTGTMTRTLKIPEPCADAAHPCTIADRYCQIDHLARANTEV